MIRRFSLAFALTLLASLAGGTVTYSAIVASGHAKVARQLTQNCPAWPYGSGLLSDGDFSQAPDPGSGGSKYYKGQTFAPSWHATKGDVDWLGSAYWQMAGLCNVDLDGDMRGGIAHSGFATTPGVGYTVSFLFSGNDDGAPQIKRMEVSAAGQSAMFTWDISNGGARHGQYTRKRWAFTAMWPTTVLKFRSHDERGSSHGPVVAAIYVSQN